MLDQCKYLVIPCKVRLLLTSSSICAISIWRLATIHQSQINDPWFDFSYLSLTSVLEPLLGITNACLPILRSLSGHFSASFSHLRSTFGAFTGKSTEKLVSTVTKKPKPFAENSHSDTRHFHHLYNHLYNHLYPFPTIDDKTQVATCTTDNDIIELVSRFDGQKAGQDTIVLTKTWNVQG